MWNYRISTHTSRVGCDAIALFNAVDASFLLTHPVWDVTHIEEKIQLDVLISTHTSRVGCDCGYRFSGRTMVISTHTSRVGCDLFSLKLPRQHQISTHTSRVGCDSYHLKQIR